MAKKKKVKAKKKKTLGKKVAKKALSGITKQREARRRALKGL